MKKTKIVCTMGPNSNDENIMRQLVKEGMDIARLAHMKNKKAVWTC